MIGLTKKQEKAVDMELKKLFGWDGTKEGLKEIAEDLFVKGLEGKNYKND